MAEDAPQAISPAQTVELPIKAVLLLFLPVSYLGGFLALSQWALEEDLGFVPFAAPRYLAAGIPVAFIALGTWVVARLMDATAPIIEPMPWRRRFRRIGTDVFAYGFVSLMGVLAYSTFAIQGLDGIYSALGWLFGLVFFLFVNAAMSISLAFIYQKSGKIKSEDKGFVAIQMPSELYHWTKQSGLAGAVAFLTSLLIVSSILLPSASSAFGGGQPRDAIFALEMNDLTDRQVYELLQIGNQTSSVRPTYILRVYVETPHSYIVEVKDMNDSTPPRYELSKNIVKSVVWIS